MDSFRMAIPLVMILSSCFTPETTAGLPCAPNRGCPEGQTCSALDICELSGTSSPSDAMAGGDAADVVDAFEGCAPDKVRCNDLCQDECTEVFSEPGEMAYSPVEGCVRVRLEAWGAGGGHGRGNTDGAAGGYSHAYAEASAGQDLIVIVGQSGGSTVTGQGGSGGNPGGGMGRTEGRGGGGGGGGFSGVFLSEVLASGALMMAGGGGGSGAGSGYYENTVAGAGGGMSGQVGRATGNRIAAGTQNSGHLPFVGQDGQTSSGTDDGGGGGGGGWYGGKAGNGAMTDGQGGAGGSGYVASGMVEPQLMAGDRSICGNALAENRGLAGNPGNPGRVIITCLPTIGSN